MVLLAAIRVRGRVKTRKELEYTMSLLRLNRVNHLVLVGEKMLPMLKKTESFITFGKINAQTLGRMLEKRARLHGDKRLSEELLKKNKIKSFTELAEKVLDNKVSLQTIGIKPVFRLNSPKKGHARGGKKKPFASGGALGDRADDVNELIERMM